MSNRARFTIPARSDRLRNHPPYTRDENGGQPVTERILGKRPGGRLRSPRPGAPDHSPKSWWWVFDTSATHYSRGALSGANPRLSFTFQRRESRRIGIDRSVDRLIDAALVEERRGSKVVDVAVHPSSIRVILRMSMLVLSGGGPPHGRLPPRNRTCASRRIRLDLRYR